MSITKRTIFFWVLVIGFFIVAPVVILRAKGYLFDWHRGVFVYSGTISFKTNPQQDIQAMLNDEMIDNSKLDRINSSFNVSGLLPANYDLKISADGFNSWNKKIDVHSGVSSDFWNVLLTRKEYEKTQYQETSGIEKFFTSPKNKSIAFISYDKNGLVVKNLDLESELISGVFELNGWRFASEEKKENIEWSPEEEYLSVPVERDNLADSDKDTVTDSLATFSDDELASAYYIIDLAQEGVINLNTFFNKKEINYVRWDPMEKNYLFFLEGEILYRANIKDALDIVEIANNVDAYDLSYESVYFVQSQNKLVFKTSLDGGAERTQITSNFPDEENPNIKRIIVYDETRIAFLTEEKKLFIFNYGENGKYFRELGENVPEMHFSNDGKKLLFWNNNEVSVYFVRNWTVQPTRAENEVNNITRYSEQLRNVQWYKDYEHIIFSVGKYVKIIELDARDRRNCLDLISTELETPFIIHNNGLEQLFFTEKENDNAVYLNSIIFPEQKPLPIIGNIGK